MVNVIVGCEESQEVTKALRELGIVAFSCDIQECSGGKPEWHIIGNLLNVIKGGSFKTQAGNTVTIKKWSCLIGFPPCTFMSNAGARWMYPIAGEISKERYKKAMEAKNFFMELLNSDIEYIALENPRPLKVVELPKYTQQIQPFEHGHPYSKRTFLWLKNLPTIMPTYYVDNHKPYIPSNTGGGKRGQKATIHYVNKKDRSKTFPGIARAMAEQWADCLK